MACLDHPCSDIGSLYSVIPLGTTWCFPATKVSGSATANGCKHIVASPSDELDPLQVTMLQLLFNLVSVTRTCRL
eukprot:CAMPEP_0172795712 /NCGR_PEP_ID=MMETSP1074-20121228/210622_1 /TAXON_ID=2916 /ORGANISM="Ceratium fusus, Strain PA161109" /LENGTH=74 /DNA_ID=CAMNT_0013632801 /DNA_START=550 /DNA_END=774 /DNA_ORIENTATION=+